MAKLDGSDKRARIDGLLSLALYDLDWKWVQDLCLALLHDADVDVVATAVLALGHVARVHRRLELERVLPELDALKGNSLVAGRVSDALDDIDVYVGRANGPNT